VSIPQSFIEREQMRIGVTGSSGFLGSHLIKALRQLPGAEVTSLKRNSSESFPETAALRSFVRDLDIIYHIAGVNRGTNEEILTGNIKSTFNLIEAIKKFGKPFPRIIFASSSQVYKQVTTPGKLINESYKTEPTTLFGVAKKTAEDLIRLSGFEYVIMRISNIYGPGCLPNYNSVIATFCHRSVNGECLKIDGNGHQKRDFIYIDDTIQAMILAGIQRGKLVSGVYNIGTGHSTSLRQMIRNIKSAGVAVNVSYSQKVSTGKNSFSLDASRFRKYFGWKAKTLPSVGIKKTILWFQKNTSL